SWASVSISDVVEVNPRFDKGGIEDNAEVSFVPMPAVGAETGEIDVSGTKLFGDVKKGYTGFLEGDVLFAKITPCMENGKMAIVPALKNGIGFGSTEFHVLRPLPGIEPKFVYYFVSSKQVRYDAEHNMTGAVGQKRVPAGYLAGKSLPLPPTNEQKRIVAKIETLFSELDKGIEALKTARDQLKVYRQAVLKHAFEGKLTARWREENKDKLETPEQLLARVPAPVQPRGGREASVEVSEGVAALAVNKPKKINAEGWAWTPLLRVARQETGHTPSREPPEYSGGNEYWIGIVDARLNHAQVINATLQKVTTEGLDTSSARTLPTGTVCLSRTASVGYVCIMGKPMATSQDFATWTCTEALEPKYLMYAIMAEGDEIRRFGKGTTHTTIYFPEIRALHIALPSVEEQRAIVAHVEEKLQQTDIMLNELSAQLARADVLRQSILKKAFSGQLVPQDPNDEPAAVLLEPIRVEKAQQGSTSKGTKRKRSA